MTEQPHDNTFQPPPQVVQPKIDPELPVLLDKVYPCHEVVRMDYHLPGCPPKAELIWEALYALVTGDPLKLPYEVIKFD